MRSSDDTAGLQLLRYASLAFLALYLPAYTVAYGVPNFLFLCNLAVILGTLGIWTRSRLLVSSQAVATLLVGAVWTLDLAGRLGPDANINHAFVDPFLKRSWGGPRHPRRRGRGCPDRRGLPCEPPRAGAALSLARRAPRARTGGLTSDRLTGPPRRVRAST